jgi:hypothetical protein
MSTCAELLEEHKDAWQSGVHHRFLDDCKAGTISENQFDAWLVQVLFSGSGGQRTPTLQQSSGGAADEHQGIALRLLA